VELRACKKKRLTGVSCAGCGSDRRASCQRDVAGRRRSQKEARATTGSGPDCAAGAIGIVTKFDEVSDPDRDRNKTAFDSDAATKLI
jgi:hypothetical protein